MKSSDGFSILELTVVVAVLAALAGISFPAFLGFIKSARIDQAKSILNSAVAECLQDYREDPDDFRSSIVPDERLGGLGDAGYEIVANKNKCTDFMIEPKDPSETYLFSLGFMIRSGKVTKVAIPASDRRSENACKSWGTCGIPPELQAEWDRLAKLESDKKACNDAFYTFLNSGSKGQKNVWDDESQSCSRAQWVLDGTRYTSKDSYDAAFTAKVGKECAAELANYVASNPPNGLYNNEKCEIRTYFFNGKNLETDDSVIYDAKAKEYNDMQCQAAELSWLQGSSNGRFNPPAGLNCTSKWKCNSSIFQDESSYLNSTCGKPPPPPPEPSCPPMWRVMRWC